MSKNKQKVTCKTCGKELNSCEDLIFNEEIGECRSCDHVHGEEHNEQENVE